MAQKKRTIENRTMENRPTDKQTIKKRSLKKQTRKKHGIVLGTAVCVLAVGILIGLVYSAGSERRPADASGDTGSDPADTTAASGSGPADSSAAAGENTSIVYLLRHGETEANVQGLFMGGGQDSPLTEEGQNQVLAAGNALKEAGIHFDFAYASELGRAQQTAGIVLDTCGQSDLTLSILPGLNDVSLGLVEGRSMADVKAEYGETSIDDYLNSLPGDGYVSPFGAEPKADFNARFNEAMTEAASKGGTVLVVAHSSAAFWLADTFPGVVNSLPNASITVLKRVNGSWELLDAADTDYAGFPAKSEGW